MREAEGRASLRRAPACPVPHQRDGRTSGENSSVHHHPLPPGSWSREARLSSAQGSSHDVRARAVSPICACTRFDQQLPIAGAHYLGRMQ